MESQYPQRSALWEHLHAHRCSGLLVGSGSRPSPTIWTHLRASGRSSNWKSYKQGNHLRQLDTALLTEMGKYQRVFLSSIKTAKLKTVFKSQVLLGVVAEAGR